MTPDEAAARLSMALRPGSGIEGKPGNLLAFNALAYYSQFAREIAAEAGPEVLADIVRAVELHSPITRRAVA